jgi:hypothetical protein
VDVEEIIEMLKEAIFRLEHHDEESAAWRIADAGGELRRLLKINGWTKLGGFDEPTGRGYELPRMIA